LFLLGNRRTLVEAFENLLRASRYGDIGPVLRRRTLASLT
jgi:hypothetical protein